MQNINTETNVSYHPLIYLDQQLPDPYGKNFLFALPRALFLYMLTFVDFNTALKLRQVCKLYKQLVEDPQLPFSKALKKRHNFLLQKKIDLLKDADEANYQEISSQVDHHLKYSDLSQETKNKEKIMEAKRSLVDKLKYNNNIVSCCLHFVACLGISAGMLATTLMYIGDYAAIEEHCAGYGDLLEWEESACVAAISQYLVNRIIQNSLYGAAAGFFLKPFDSCCIEPRQLEKGYTKLLQIDVEMNQSIKINHTTHYVWVYKNKDIVLMLTGLILFSILFAMEPLNFDINSCLKTINEKPGFSYTKLDETCVDSYLSSQTNIIRGLTIPSAFFVAFSLYTICVLLCTTTKKVAVNLSQNFHSIFHHNNNETRPLLQSGVRSYDAANNIQEVPHLN